MIKQAIEQDIKSAMLSGDKRLANALRNVKSSILAVEVDSGKREEGLSEPEMVSILQKEMKKRTEAAALYHQGGNDEQADEEKFEAELIQKYLPAQLDETEINALIDQAVAELGLELNNQAMGQLIGAVKQKAGGAADGALVARLVKARLP
jgi:uncharacterized protein YqeY